MGKDAIESNDGEPGEVDHVKRRMIRGVEPDSIGVDETDRGDEPLTIGE